MQPSCLELEIELVCFTLKKCIIRGLIVIFYTRKLTREIPFEIEIITDSILEMTHILCLLVTNNYGSISISNLKSTYAPWLFLKQIAGWSGTPSDILDCLKTLLFSKLLLLFVCFQIFTYVVVGLGFTCFFTGLIGWVGGVVESTLIWRIFKNVFLYTN